MFLIAKLITSQTTILLFKLVGATDKNNVFAICPLHVIGPNIHKVKVQLALEEEYNIKEIIYVTVCLFPIQHTFLDIAMGIVENPEVINNNVVLKGLSYLNTIPGGYRCITNKHAKILYANKNGVANSLDTKILSMNYTLGDKENLTLMNGLPSPGGFILTDFKADSGSSGSVLTVDNNVLGIIIAAANINDQDNGNENANSNVNYSLAVDMFYVLPHINQCVSAIDKFTNNNPDNLVRLCLFNTMSTFTDDLKPVVNSLGSSYIFHHMTTELSPEKYITLTDIQNFLSVSSLRLYQEGLTDSILVKTVLNTNQEFIDYFFNKQHNSVVIFKRANYYDKVFGRRVDIDFVTDSVNANILDWSFRGDQFQPLVLYLQTKTINNDGSVLLSVPVPFTFVSSPTIDTVHNVTYPRTTTEIPGVFFNRNDALVVLMNNFNIKSITRKNVNINWLNNIPTNIRGQNFRNISNWWELDFSNVDIRRADFTMASLMTVSFRRSILTDAIFDSARLVQTNFYHANLSRASLIWADLTNSNLTGANLSRANLTRAIFDSANLTRADLYSANLTDAYLGRANLTGAILRVANLTGANFSRANLTGADLRGTDLRGANLRGANLTGADLRGAHLLGADLTNAIGADLRNVFRGP